MASTLGQGQVVGKHRALLSGERRTKLKFQEESLGERVGSAQLLASSLLDTGAVELSARGNLSFPEAARWAPASSNQENPVPQGHRPQRGTTALGPRGPPVHCPPASNPCLMPRTRIVLLAVPGSSLLCFFHTSLPLLNYASYPQGTSKARGGEGRSPILGPHQHSAPGFYAQAPGSLQSSLPAFTPGIAPYRRAEACGPDCFIVPAQPLGAEPHWPSSHGVTSAEGEASDP